MVYSMAALLMTGSEPGSPRQTGQTAELGSAPNSVGQPQNIFAAVPSSTCVSSPISGSYLRTASSKGTGAPERPAADSVVACVIGQSPSLRAVARLAWPGSSPG